MAAYYVPYPTARNHRSEIHVCPYGGLHVDKQAIDCESVTLNDPASCRFNSVVTI